MLYTTSINTQQMPGDIILTLFLRYRTVPDLIFGAIAQLGERLHGMQEVGGSIPPGSTNSGIGR